MRFYDREKELQCLEDIRQASLDQAQMTVLVGRRRIGKTELVLRCGGSGPLLYFFVARKAEAMLCRDFVEEAEAKLGVPIGDYTSFSRLFQHLLRLSADRPMTLIIDEFQDWARINPSVFSEMQRAWDLGRRNSRMHLIVSGSIYSLMHRIFEDSKEPLFSRAHRIINLRPFSTGVLRQILADHNPAYTQQDLLTLFSITGGVAWYVDLLMSARKTTAQKMTSYLTEENSPFINEGRNLLVEEFGADYAIYFSILACIAGGQRTRSEIEAMIGVRETGGYLERLLTHYGLIEKHTPIYSKERSRCVRYVISDNFITLWFRFFYKYQHFIESGALGQLRRLIDRDFASVEGFMLERFFISQMRESGLYTRIGKYWNRKGENEIDIVAVNEIDHTAEVYEVKMQKSRFDAGALNIKVEALLQDCPPLRSMSISMGCLSLDDI